jgi:hypothetical protein
MSGVKMRKFLITLFILLALGVALFFLGWAQFKVPPGSYGVMRSKTHGIDPTLIREGEFRWVWYKLIPTNVEISSYLPARVERQISRRGALPSADIYGAFADVKADFSYEFNASLSFHIGGDALIPLVREQNLQGQDDLDAYAEALGRDIEALVIRRMENLGEAELRTILETGTSAAMEEAIRRDFPMVEGLSCGFQTIRFPDYRLYDQVRELYAAYLAKQRDYVDLDARAAERINSRFRLDELAGYGDLLTRFPVLLEYLKLGL